MEQLAARVIAAVRRIEYAHRRESLEGSLLAALGEVRLTDSTCHVLKRLAAGWAPSTSTKRPAFHHVLRRLKESESPRIERVVRGHPKAKRCVGLTTDQALDTDLLKPSEVRDLDVHLTGDHGDDVLVRRSACRRRRVAPQGLRVLHRGLGHRGKDRREDR